MSQINKDITSSEESLKEQKEAIDSTKNEIEQLTNKTAKLIRAAVEAPAALAGADAEPFKKYGESVGLLFQITDDILDETSDLKTLGKSVKKDFAENNKNLCRNSRC